ncbi:MAG TPA: Ig-like domain-containing protein, partial [bacterium]|nr:Ig-like domain-containing protein [bacterium]
MRSFTVSQILLFVIALFLGCTKPNTIDWDKVFGDRDASPDNMVTLDEEEWPDEESPAEETTPPDNDTSEDDEYVAEHDMPEGDDVDVATDHVLPTEEDILLSDDAVEVEDTVTDPDFDLVVDETSPWITSTEPESDATDVLVDVIITITFSEALDGTKVTGENILLERSGESVLVAITYRSDDHSVLITPTTPLDHGVAYTVTVRTGITDLAGNAFEAEHVFGFVTTLCGNGVPDLGEQCDDGNTDPCDGCLNNCT